MLNVLRFEYGSMQLDPFKNGVELKIVKSFGEKEVSLKAIDKAFRQVALMDYRAEKKNLLLYCRTSPAPPSHVLKFSFRDAEM